MNGGGDIWRQRLWVWLPAALFFAANLVAFGVYRLGYAGDVQSLERSLKERQEELHKVEASRAERLRLIGGARRNRELITRLYDERFSTRRRRLTEITAEVKKLARQAGLEPRELSYPEEAIEDFGLVKRSFVFGVNGDYLELRKFINLLELSDYFLTLEEVTLSGGGEGEGSELHINLRLSTLFAREEAADATPGGVS
jgi:type IV pilus assembly protein PilO